MEEAVSSGPEELAAMPEQFRNPGIHSRSMSDDEEEDDLALLQKHTKVRIVGNNRTRYQRQCTCHCIYPSLLESAL